MKKIILLFFTFLGICSCFSQEVPDTVNLLQSTMTNIPPLKKDSLVAKEKSSFRIYPNPAKNKAEIEIKGFDAGYVKIQLIS